MLLNFSDRTRTGVFNMIWPLAFEKGKCSVYKIIKFRKSIWQFINFTNFDHQLIWINWQDWWLTYIYNNNTLVDRDLTNFLLKCLTFTVKSWSSKFFETGNSLSSICKNMYELNPPTTEIKSSQLLHQE